MIGGNDFCSDVCFQTNATEWMNAVQEKYLIQSLKYLRDNMPRLVGLYLYTALFFFASNSQYLYL